MSLSHRAVGLVHKALVFLCWGFLFAVFNCNNRVIFRLPELPPFTSSKFRFWGICEDY